MQNTYAKLKTLTGKIYIFKRPQRNLCSNRGSLW